MNPCWKSQISSAAAGIMGRFRPISVPLAGWVLGRGTEGSEMSKQTSFIKVYSILCRRGKKINYAIKHRDYFPLFVQINDFAFELDLKADFGICVQTI